MHVEFMQGLQKGMFYLVKAHRSVVGQSITVTEINTNSHGAFE